MGTELRAFDLLNFPLALLPTCTTSHLHYFPLAQLPKCATSILRNLHIAQQNKGQMIHEYGTKKKLKCFRNEDQYFFPKKSSSKTSTGAFSRYGFFSDRYFLAVFQVYFRELKWWDGQHPPIPSSARSGHQHWHQGSSQAKRSSHWSPESVSHNL